MKSRKASRRLVAALAAMTALALGLPAVSQAGPLTDNAPSCSTQVLFQPFLPWGDIASYTLNPGGAFESGAAWQLNGASVGSGNEPFYVSAPSDSHSLTIGDGGTAVSPPICVGIEHPDIRFFATSGSTTATLSVEVLFEDSSGNVLSAPIGKVVGGTAWGPTAPMPIVANLLPLLPGNHTAVAFRFTASGGSFQLDDLWVDPYSSR